MPASSRRRRALSAAAQPRRSAHWSYMRSPDARPRSDTAPVRRSPARRENIRTLSTRGISLLHLHPGTLRNATTSARHASVIVLGAHALEQLDRLGERADA